MEEKAVEFKVGKENLRGTLFVPEGTGPYPAVVFCHGRGSSRKGYLPMAKQLSEKGFLTLAFDFRGCGESDGIFEKQTHNDGLLDTSAAIKFILNENVDRTRIGLCGASFGAFAIGMILPRYPWIKSICLRAPAASDDKFLSLTGMKGDKLFSESKNWENSSVYQNIGNFKGALLIIKSEHDELIPDSLVEKYYQSAENTSERRMEILEGAHHRLAEPSLQEAFYRKVDNWFGKTL